MLILDPYLLESFLKLVHVNLNSAGNPIEIGGFLNGYCWASYRSAFLRVRFNGATKE
jgi:hypothetical protein